HGLESCLTQDVDRAGRAAQSIGAETQLLGALLATGVEYGAAGGLQSCRCLEQQGRLADAGFAADQGHRTGHQATTQDEVEFGKAPTPARDLPGLDAAR